MTVQPMADTYKAATRKRRSRDGLAPVPYPRLTRPYVRDHGQLRPSSWDEALERVGGALRTTVERYGPQAVGFFSCSKATNEVNYLVQKFARVVVGTNNIDSCNRT